MKNVLLGILVLAVVLGLGWVFLANDTAQQAVFAPKREEIRRDTFENTTSYNQGMIQELQNMRFEYIKATPEQQRALRSIILHRAAAYPADRLPYELNTFIEGLK